MSLLRNEKDWSWATPFIDYDFLTMTAPSGTKPLVVARGHDFGEWVECDTEEAATERAKALAAEYHCPAYVLKPVLKVEPTAEVTVTAL